MEPNNYLFSNDMHPASWELTPEQMADINSTIALQRQALTSGVDMDTLVLNKYPHARPPEEVVPREVLELPQPAPVASKVEQRRHRYIPRHVLSALGALSFGR